MVKKDKFMKEDEDLLVEFGVEVEAKKAKKYMVKEECIIVGFEEI